MLEINHLVPIWITFFGRVEEEWLEVDSDDLHSFGHDSDSEEKNRVEFLLAGAYNLHSSAAPSIMPAERDSLLLLDPDMNGKFKSASC